MKKISFILIMIALSLVGAMIGCTSQPPTPTKPLTQTPASTPALPNTSSPTTPPTSPQTTEQDNPSPTQSLPTVLPDSKPPTTPAESPTPSSTPPTTPPISPNPPPTPTTPTPAVTRLFTYLSRTFFYQIDYPPTFSVKDSDPYTVIIEGTTGGIAVLVDKLSVDETPKTYFALISAGKKKQLPTWTSSSEIEIKENNVTIGYKFDYSNMVNNKKWIGKGMVFKKGGLGFYVVYTTFETDWEANKEMAVRCLDSFVLPKIASGSYSNTTLGISLTLPKNWSLIETVSTSYPFVFWPPYDGNFVRGEFHIDDVTPGTTAKQWCADMAVKLGSTDGGIQIPFSFANSVTGYEFSDLIAEEAEITGKLRFIALASGSHMYYFLFVGTTTAMDAQKDSVSTLARSLVISSSETPSS